MRSAAQFLWISWAICYVRNWIVVQKCFLFSDLLPTLNINKLLQQWQWKFTNNFRRQQNSVGAKWGDGAKLSPTRRDVNALEFFLLFFRSKPTVRTLKVCSQHTNWTELNCSSVRLVQLTVVRRLRNYLKGWSQHTKWVDWTDLNWPVTNDPVRGRVYWSRASAWRLAWLQRN